MDDFIDEFEKQLLQNGVASRVSIKGCTDKEIVLLEQHFEIRLPVVYRDFLMRMGHQAGKLCRGTDIFYSSLFDNREGFEELLKIDGFPFDLKPSLFVFSGHQGYIYHFFDVMESLIDPPIYGYRENDLLIKRIHNSFSSFLLESLREEIRDRL